MAGVDDEVGDDLIEDADSFRKRLLRQVGRWNGVTVGVEHVFH